VSKHPWRGGCGRAAVGWPGVRSLLHGCVHRYNFKPKAKVKVTSLEEAERLMKQGDKVPKHLQSGASRPHSARLVELDPRTDTAAPIAALSISCHAWPTEPAAFDDSYASVLSMALAKTLEEKTTFDDLIDEAIDGSAEYTESMLDAEFNDDGDEEGGATRCSLSQAHRESAASAKPAIAASIGSRFALHVLTSASAHQAASSSRKSQGLLRACAIGLELALCPQEARRRRRRQRSASCWTKWIQRNRGSIGTAHQICYWHSCMLSDVLGYRFVGPCKCHRGWLHDERK
jgi:hypothetical protein